MEAQPVTTELALASVVNGVESYHALPDIGKPLVQDIKHYIECLNRGLPKLNTKYIMYIAGHVSGDCYIIPDGKVCCSCPTCSACQRVSTRICWCV